MVFAGMVKSSFVDFPGHIACVLFTPGCNYDCFYCHNRGLIDGDYEVIDNEIVNHFLDKRRQQLDGVVITGGEPTLQHDLIPFLKQLREKGYKIKLDTNGSALEKVEEILKLKLCDYYAVDYKAPKNRYKEICGEKADAEKTLETIGLLKKYNVDFEVRTTVIPQLVQEDLIAMANELPLLPKYVLNRYRKPEGYLLCDEERVSAKPYSKEQIQQFEEVIRVFQPNIEL